MKISFSTVGCPNWRWNEVLSAAKDLGYDGIEFRGLGEDIYVPDIRIFRPENLAATRAQLTDEKIEIPCIASDCLLHMDDRDYALNLRQYIDLAAGLGTPYVRVLGDTWGSPGENVNTELVRKRLVEAAPYAGRANVTLLLESNGIFADTKRLAAMIESVESDSVMALWDINHPVRNYGESVGETVRNIGKYIRHVHVKDSAVENGKLVYKMLGYGDMPVREAVSALKELGYEGYLSLEWVKLWNSELEDAGIVFSHFIYTIRKYLR